MAFLLKTRFGPLSLVLGGLLLGGVGCHKPAPASRTPQQASADSTPQPAPDNPNPQPASADTSPQTLNEGLARLRSELVSSDAAVKSNFFHSVSYGIRYGDYPAALAGLQQIASDPSLTDEQKKTVSAVSDLIKAQAAQQTSAAAH